MKTATGQRGQVSTEYMLVISMVVLAVVAAGYLFVGGFGDSVRQLAADIERIFEEGINGVGTVEELHDPPELPATQTARQDGIVPFYREFAPKDTEEIVMNTGSIYASESEISAVNQAGAAMSGNIGFALAEMLNQADTGPPPPPDDPDAVVDGPKGDEEVGPLRTLKKERR